MVRFTVDNRNRLIFYGNPVGYVKDDAAVVDEMFRTDELTLQSGTRAPFANWWRQ